LSNFRQVADPDETILAGKRQRLVCTLRLGHAEDLVVASIVNVYMSAVLDRQSSSAWENSILKIILRPDRTRRSQMALTPASGPDS